MLDFCVVKVLECIILGGVNTENKKSEKTSLPLRKASSLQVAMAMRQLCNSVTTAHVATAHVSMVAQA